MRSNRINEALYGKKYKSMLSVAGSICPNRPWPDVVAKEFAFSCRDAGTGEETVGVIEADDIYIAQADLNRRTKGTALACRLDAAL